MCKAMFDEYDAETRARIIDLAMTLSCIDQGLVQVIRGPFSNPDYDLPAAAHDRARHGRTAPRVKAPRVKAPRGKAANGATS